MDCDLQILDVGVRAYRPVLEFQHALVDRRVRGMVPDTLVLVEHEPVYTLGRGASQSNILLSEQAIDKSGIDVVRIGRGGDVTYHGPGQLVAYPVVHLGDRSRRVARYVHGLEEMLIGTLAAFGVDGKRDERHPGVWVGSNKIAALGVRITRNVTMHGIALNVTTDLSYYGGIVPCGITDRGVTSLSEQVPDVRMEAVKPVLVREFARVFGYDTEVAVQTVAGPLDMDGRE
jgi:lipoyl(octanoyl) transferase